MSIKNINGKIQNRSLSMNMGDDQGVEMWCCVQGIEEIKKDIEEC